MNTVIGSGIGCNVVNACVACMSQKIFSVRIIITFVVLQFVVLKVLLCAHQENRRVQQYCRANCKQVNPSRSFYFDDDLPQHVYKYVGIGYVSTH